VDIQSAALTGPAIVILSTILLTFWLTISGSWPMAPTSATDYTLPGDDARLRER